jgi:putative glutamine amidotransferase
MKPLIGIPACTKTINGHILHATPARYAQAVVEVAGGIPVLIPPMGAAMDGLLDRIDGLLLSGSPSNVSPDLYGATEDLTPRSHDPARDATTLPLLRAAIGRGMPLLAICRGVQELNVAFGGTLHQQVHLVAGRLNHDAPEEAIEDQYLPRHEVRLAGKLRDIIGEDAISVNSLHEQALDRLGGGLVAEAWAPDGTVEAVRVAAAPGFALGVQWHPEWKAGWFSDRKRLIGAFGEACGQYQGR